MISLFWSCSALPTWAQNWFTSSSEKHVPESWKLHVFHARDPNKKSGCGKLLKTASQSLFPIFCIPWHNTANYALKNKSALPARWCQHLSCPYFNDQWPNLVSLSLFHCVILSSWTKDHPSVSFKKATSKTVLHMFLMCDVVQRWTKVLEISRIISSRINSALMSQQFSDAELRIEDIFTALLRDNC